MATWNEAYENLPENSNNPGRGAEAIREFKNQVRTRMEIEKFFGPNEDEESAKFGLNKEGSARVTSLDEYTGNVNRDDAVVDEINAGRVRVDSTDRTGSDVKIYDGDAEATAPAGKFAADDRRFKKIEALVYTDNTGSATEWFPFYDIDSIVDTKFDQTIDGRKTFDLPPYLPEDVEINLGGSTVDANNWFTPTINGLSSTQKLNAVQLNNVLTQLNKMLLSHLLDPDDSLVTSYLNAISPGYISNGRVDQTINVTTVKAGTIEGDSVTGAVYI